MSYSKVHDINQKSWALSCPAYLDKGALFVNNENKQVVLRLRFRNISKQKIMQLEVTIDKKDHAGEVVGNIDLVYTDLAALPHSFFGEDSPKAIGYDTTRKADIFISKVIFSDGSTWTKTDKEIVEYMPRLMIDAFSNDLIDTYKRLHKDTYSNSIDEHKYMFDENEMYWTCTCGILNTVDNEYCANCSSKKTWIREHSSEEMLREKNTIFNDQDELTKKRDYEQLQCEKAERKKRLYKNSAIMAVAVVLVSIPILVFLVIPSIKINHLEGLIENDNYQSVVDLYDDYQNKKYYKDYFQKAIHEMVDQYISDKEFSKALDLISTYDSENDFNELHTSVLYWQGVNHMLNENYDDAIDLFTQAGEYQGSKVNLNEAYFRKFKQNLYDNHFDKAAEAETNIDDEAYNKKVRDAYYERFIGLLSEDKIEDADKLLPIVKSYNHREDIDERLEIAYAKRLSVSGDFIGAMNILNEVYHYESAREIIDVIRNQYLSQALSLLEVGDVLFMGNYIDDNDRYMIAWTVKEKQDSIALLLANEGFNPGPFDYTYKNDGSGTTWENSYARERLNESFFAEAFTPNEKKVITEDQKLHDRIFIFSRAEIERYLPADDERKARDMLDDWWIRPTENVERVSYVFGESGKIYDYGKDGRYSAKLRPAMWINIEEE